MRKTESINLIYRDPKVRGGRPCIVGTGLRVMDIVLEQRHGESDAARIADLYDIERSHVQAALAYYQAHKSEIEADIRADDELVALMKAEASSSFGGIRVWVAAA